MANGTTCARAPKLSTGTSALKSNTIGPSAKLVEFHQPRYGGNRCGVIQHPRITDRDQQTLLAAHRYAESVFEHQMAVLPTERSLIRCLNIVASSNREEDDVELLSLECVAVPTRKRYLRVPLVSRHASRIS